MSPLPAVFASQFTHNCHWVEDYTLHHGQTVYLFSLCYSLVSLHLFLVKEGYFSDLALVFTNYVYPISYQESQKKQTTIDSFFT